MTTNSKTIIYALSCEHAAPASSTFSEDRIGCAWCQVPQQIVGVVEYEWRARCSGCTFSRWAGLSKHNAAIFARNHISHRPAHKVYVEYTRNPEATRVAIRRAAINGRKRRT